MVEDKDKRKTRKVVRKIWDERRKTNLLKDLKIRKQFEEKEIKLVDVGVANLWGNFKDGVLKACDEVCGKKRGWEIKEVHGGGMKIWRRQFQERKTHKRQCDRTVLMRISGGMKAWRIKQLQKQWERRPKRHLLNYKIAQMGWLG